MQFYYESITLNASLIKQLQLKRECNLHFLKKIDIYSLITRRRKVEY